MGKYDKAIFKVEEFDQVVHATFESQNRIMEELNNLERMLSAAEDLREVDNVSEHCTKLIAARVKVSQLLQKLTVVQKRVETIKILSRKTSVAL